MRSLRSTVHGSGSLAGSAEVDLIEQILASDASRLTHTQTAEERGYRMRNGRPWSQVGE